MRVLFRKLSDQTHALEIVRPGGAMERVECETRSYLTHDLLHFAVESAAELEDGFWGRLARGATLAEMNDRTRPMDIEMASIERLVGALSAVVKGVSAEEVVDRLRRFAAVVDAPLPAWLTEGFVRGVEERMRELGGRWKATRRLDALELAWPQARDGAHASG